MFLLIVGHSHFRPPDATHNLIYPLDHCTGNNNSSIEQLTSSSVWRIYVLYFSQFWPHVLKDQLHSIRWSHLTEPYKSNSILRSWHRYLPMRLKASTLRQINDFILGLQLSPISKMDGRPCHLHTAGPGSHSFELYFFCSQASALYVITIFSLRQWMVGREPFKLQVPIAVSNFLSPITSLHAFHHEVMNFRSGTFPSLSSRCYAQLRWRPNSWTPFSKRDSMVLNET